VREERREERLLLARLAFETATERAILSFAERDRVGGELRNPSGLLLEVASRRSGGPLEPRGAGFRRVAPPRPAASARERPADATDLDLALLDGPRPWEGALGRILRDERARHLPRVLRAAEARWGGARLGAFDGVLEEPGAIARVRALEPERWSPTRLEALVNCPFSYLLGLLGLDAAEEDPDDYDPRERGALFHEIYETVFRTLADRGRLPLAPEALPEAFAALDVAIFRERARLAAEPALRRLRGGATLAGLRADLATTLAQEAHREPARRTVPVRFELAFGEPEAGADVGFDLGRGSRLPLRGKVDRVDRTAAGDLEVVDLKTGRRRASPGALRHAVDGKIEVRLQLPLYLDAVGQLLGRRASRAAFRYATADAGFEEIPYGDADLARDRDELGRLLAHAVDSARQGWFPCTPRAGECCRRSLARACGPSVAERFLRKLDDPELRAHVALVRGVGDDVASGGGA
jgi:hypothetical protein